MIFSSYLPLRLLLQLSLYALLLIASSYALAAAGKVDTLAGEVKLIDSQNNQFYLAPGDEINQGDTIQTGPNAWALLKMVDGGSLTLRANTHLKIDTFNYTGKNDASEKSIVSLLKGAFRAITGSIGHRNSQIKTPTATIGVRGTDHEAIYISPEQAEEEQEEPGTYDKVNDGETFIQTPNGLVNIKRGQAGFVPLFAENIPQLLTQLPPIFQRHAEFDKLNIEQRLNQLHQRLKEGGFRNLKRIIDPSQKAPVNLLRKLKDISASRNPSRAQRTENLLETWEELEKLKQP